MSSYVGIDVHRRRSQIAIVESDGTVRANRNVTNDPELVLSVIGDLPAGTPVAFEAAYGWGWLVELLDGYGFEPHLVHPLRCKAIASARLKNDKVDAAILAQLLRTDLLPEAWIAPYEIRARRAECATAANWYGCAPWSATGSTRCSPTTAATARPGASTESAAPGWPRSTCHQSRAGSSTTCVRSSTRSRSPSTRPIRNWPPPRETIRA